MSTRANIIVRESYNDSFGNKKSNELIFYRHSDGYPEGTLPALNKFMDWLKSGKIRNNLTQSAGWLIVLGALEYGTIPDIKKEEKPNYLGQVFGDIETTEEPKDWKVGAFEPTNVMHGDIEWLYEIDLVKKTLKYKKA